MILAPSGSICYGHWVKLNWYKIVSQKFVQTQAFKHYKIRLHDPYIWTDNSNLSLWSYRFISVQHSFPFVLRRNQMKVVGMIPIMKLHEDNHHLGILWRSQVRSFVPSVLGDRRRLNLLLLFSMAKSFLLHILKSCSFQSPANHDQSTILDHILFGPNFRISEAIVYGHPSQNHQEALVFSSFPPHPCCI